MHCVALSASSALRMSDDAEPPAATAAPSRLAAQLCACGQPSKYRCPRCAACSCSAACVNKHKAGGGGAEACSGKRDVAAFVPLNSFTDAHLYADLAFLEEAQRVGDRAKRAREAQPAPKPSAGRASRLQKARGAAPQTPRSATHAYRFFHRPRS